MKESLDKEKELRKVADKKVALLEARKPCNSSAAEVIKAFKESSEYMDELTTDFNGYEAFHRHINNTYPEVDVSMSEADDDMLF